MINGTWLNNGAFKKWLIILLINISCFVIITSGLIIAAWVKCIDQTYCINYVAGWLIGAIILLINQLIAVYQIQLYKLFHKKLLIVLPLFKIMLYGAIVMIIWLSAFTNLNFCLIIGILQCDLFLWIHYFIFNN